MKNLKNILAGIYQRYKAKHFPPTPPLTYQQRIERNLRRMEIRRDLVKNWPTPETQKKARTAVFWMVALAISIAGAITNYFKLGGFVFILLTLVIFIRIFRRSLNKINLK